MKRSFMSTAANGMFLESEFFGTIIAWTNLIP